MPTPEEYLSGFVSSSPDLRPGSVFADADFEDLDDFDEDAYAREFLADDEPFSPSSSTFSQSQTPGTPPSRIQGPAGGSLNSFLRDLQASNAAAQQNQEVRSLFDPSLIEESYERFSRNPEAFKANLLAESFGRYRDNSAIIWPNNRRASAFNAVRDASVEGKQQAFNPAGSWRTNYLPSDLERAYKIAEASVGAKDKAQKFLGSFSNPFKGNVRDFVPDFIANPLALRNPTVQKGGIATPGSQLNPSVMDFLSTQTGSALDRRLPAMGGTVSVALDPNSDYEVEFQGASGFKRPGLMRRDLKNTEARIEALTSKQTEGRPLSLREDLELEEKLEIRDRLQGDLNLVEQNPYISQAVRYQLGRALEQVPPGSGLTAAPIGGAKGARAREYSRISKGALKTIPQTPKVLGLGDRIQSTKIGPTAFRDYLGNEIAWNPSELKDSLIRTGFGVDRDVDVSSLRDNPMSPFINKGKIDFNRPVITTDSPIYRFRQGLKGSASVGAADFIPSPEAIQSFYKGDSAKGVRQMATDFVSGIPVAAGAGTVAGLVPGAAAVMPGVGLGLTGVAAGQAANEVVRQQTGEGIVPKFRQFIGTSPRTGVSSAQRTTPFVTPQVKPLTSAQRKEMSRQSNRNELQRRIDLFRERFNPSKGEFGLSEVLFGR